MSSQLCIVCRSIPGSVWSPEYGLFETCALIKAKLQSFKEMERASAKGCQLCTMFVVGMKTRAGTPKNLNSCLHIRRSFAHPHSGIYITSDEGTGQSMNLFFYVVPRAWSELEAVQINSHVDNLQTMKVWMQECRSTHTNCSKSRTGEYTLPTRLLDVNAFEGRQETRLISSSKISQTSIPEYLTLSHCWGDVKTHSIKLLEKNKEDLMTRIPITDLSNTFRDAVKMTRELGFRYLWIDSLCIIQDSSADWAREASLMAEVYGNAFCTLAALSSKDSTGGLNLVTDIQKISNSSCLEIGSNWSQNPRVRLISQLPIRWQKEYEGIPDSASEKGQGTLLRTRTDSLNKDYAASSSPLRFRAWVLQERELSRRTIHFAKNQILWECRSLRASGQLPWQEESNVEPSSDPWLMRSEPATHGEEERLRHRHRWYKLIEDYTSRQLSFYTDKLPALSGLAKANQTHFPNAEYIAGLWTSHLPASLLWQAATGAAKRHKTYIAPSWSWASLQGSITYDSQRLRPSSTWGDRHIYKEDFTGYFHLDVEKAYSRPEHEDKYSAITEAHLVLRGAQIIDVDCSSKPVGPGNRVDMTGEALTRGGEQVGVLFRDSVDDVLTELFYLPVRPEDHAWSLHRNDFQAQLEDFGMGLVLVKRSADAYARVGLGRWVLQSAFESIPPATITLV